MNVGGFLFVCFQWFCLGPFYGMSVNIVGCVVEMTSVAITGGNLGRVCVCVQGEGVKIQSSKMQIARKKKP